MNEFAYSAGVYGHPLDGTEGLVGLPVRLAEAPGGPLYGRHVSPDGALAANVASRHA